MRICMIGQKGIPATYGGIERHVEEISGRLVSMGHEVYVYCRPYYTPNELKVYEGVNLIHLPSVRTKHLDAASHTMFATWHALTHGMDVLHYHALGPSAFAVIPHVVRRPVVVTVHGLDWQREKWGRFATWALRRSEWCAVHLATKTVVVSKTMKSYFEKKYNRAVVYIPNGRGLFPLRPPTRLHEFGLEPNKYILFVGRIVPEKGCHLLIEAYSRLETDFKLAIVGSSSFTQRYEQRLRETAGKGVVFLSWMHGEMLEELWSNAYMVVHPSTIEGLSISLLEAMSYGRCVLASDIPENMEAIGEGGFSFRGGDAGDLEEKLRELLTDRAKVEETGRKGRERIGSAYNWDTIVEDISSTYEEVGKSRRKGIG